MIIESILLTIFIIVTITAVVYVIHLFAAHTYKKGVQDSTTSLKRFEVGPPCEYNGEEGQYYFLPNSSNTATTTIDNEQKWENAFQEVTKPEPAAATASTSTRSTNTQAMLKSIRDRSQKS